jgi:plastocyanin
MEERERQARKGASGRVKRARWLLFGGVSAAVMVVAATAAPAGGERSRLAADVTVEARDDIFVEAQVTIYQGETVTWTQAGSRPHNVRFDDGTFEQPADPTSSPWLRPRRFDAVGSFRYYCEAHGGPNGSGMSGTVTVLATPGSPPPGGGPPPPGGGPPPPGGGTPPPGGGTPPPGGGTPPPGGGGNPPPGGRASTKVTLQVSDATPARGARVRFFGTVRPARDGRLVQLQRRTRGGSYLTVARIRLRDAGSTRSKFSKRLRVLGDAVFRARLPADRAHEVGVSRTKRLNVS